MSEGSSLDNSGLLNQVLSTLNRIKFIFRLEKGLESKISHRWCKNLPVRSSFVFWWVLTAAEGCQPTPAHCSLSPNRLCVPWHMGQVREEAFLQARDPASSTADRYVVRQLLQPPAADVMHQSSSTRATVSYFIGQELLYVWLPILVWKRDFSFTYFLFLVILEQGFA